MRTQLWVVFTAFNLCACTGFIHEPDGEPDFGMGHPAQDAALEVDARPRDGAVHSADMGTPPEFDAFLDDAAIADQGVADASPTPDAGPPPECVTGEPGECGAGVLEMIDGEEVCTPLAEPTDEVCNLLDDDCDGAIDEGLVDACGRCDGPPRDPCNGLDDDCDGTIDEDPCPDRATCSMGACLDECTFGECFDSSEICIAGDLCAPPCMVADCPAGLVCDDGACLDLCAGIDCADGAVCREGLCVADDCHVIGCEEGQRCRAGACAPDPCAGVECEPGAFCREGGCAPSCAAVSCPLDARCVDGACAPDLCFGIICDGGSTCTDGVCHLDACGGACGPGRRCRAGACEDDPCEGVRCPAGERCDSNSSEAQCVADWL